MEGLEAGATFGEDYRVVRTLYTGGLSTIYEVEQRTSGARRALKVVHGDLGKDEAIRAAFLREAQRAAHVNNGQRDFTVAQCRVTTFCGYFTNATECRRNQVIQTFENRLVPTLKVTKFGRIEFAGAVALATGGFIYFRPGLFLREYRQAEYA